MSKTATKSAETIEFPAFDTAAGDQIRAFAEKGVAQTRETYEKLKSGAEEMQKTIESTVESARGIGSDMSLKSIAMMRSNADAGFDHLEKLVSAKSVSEMIELQTAYVRACVEASVVQAREMQALTSKAAEELSRPVKGAFEKTMRELKVA